MKPSTTVRPSIAVAVVVMVVVVAAAVVAVTVLRGDATEETAGGASARLTEDSADDGNGYVPTTTATTVRSRSDSASASSEGAAPPADRDDDPVPLADGTLLRLNGVEHDAGAWPGAPRSSATPMTVTRLDVEACAGVEGLRVHPGSWQGLLTDGSVVVANVDAGDHPTIGLGVGGCIRGRVDLEVPLDARLAAVRFVDDVGAELSRWTDLEPVEARRPLEPIEPPDLLDPGERVVLHGGESAEIAVVSVDDEPHEDGTPTGRRRTTVAVEHCSEALPVAVSPLAWFGVTSSNEVGEVIGGDLPSVVLEPDECASGTIVFELPDHTELENVVMTGFLFTELARWSVA